MILPFLHRAPRGRACRRSKIFGAVLLVLASAPLARADQATGHVRVVIDNAATGTVSVEVSSGREPARRWSAQATVGEPSNIAGLPPGAYHVSVTTASGGSAAADVSIGAGEEVSFYVNAGPGGTLQLTLADRAASSQATRLDARQLRDLPAGSGLWGVLDTASPFVVTDRIDTGGLALGTPARVGSRGASWTRSNVRLGELDIARGPAGPDQLAWLADLEAIDAVAVSSGAATPDVATPGPTITLVPRRAEPGRHGAIDAAFTAPGMVATNDSPGIPSIARVKSWAGGSAEFGGRVGSRAGIFLSASTSALDAHERAASATVTSSVTTAFLHAVGHLDERTQLRLLGTVQRLARPSDQLPRAVADSRERDVFLQAQAAWEHLTANGARMDFSAGYQHGRFKHSTGGLSQVGFDRATEGPAPPPATDPATSRFEARLVFAAPERRGHRVESGLVLARSASSFRAGTSLPLAESVDGFPARVWLASDPGAASARRAFHLAGYVNDEVRPGGSLTINLGLRLGLSNGSSEGVQQGLTWWTVLPRLGIRWKTRIATVFGSYGRYQDELPLQVLAFGDPGEPVRDVYRWEDANANGTFEPAELGKLVARSGRGADLASFDPKLRAPKTDEVTFGAERGLGSHMVLSATGIVRRERSLLHSTNVGAPASSYGVRLIPDRGEDWDSPGDDRLLVVYDRFPSSFGQDRYLLTNAPDGASYEGIEIAWRASTVRWWSFAGASAYRAEGQGGNRGFRADENDQGVIGELLENPNADSYSRGRLFFDRAYVLKWAVGYHAPHGITAAVTARYQDGQPFSRLVVVPDLAQGPEIVSAYFAGRTRFTFTATVDARLEKQFAVGASRAAVRLELYNLTNLGNEVEEKALTGPDFRRTTAVQPPLTLRLGFRVEF